MVKDTIKKSFLKKILAFTIKFAFSLMLFIIFTGSFKLKADDSIVLSYYCEDDGITYTSFIGNDGICYLYLPKGIKISGIILKSNNKISRIEGATLKNGKTINVKETTFSIYDKKDECLKVSISTSDLNSCSFSLQDVTLWDIQVNEKGLKYGGNTVYLYSGNTKPQSFENVEIKGRGNYTWSLPKRSYQFKLDKKADIFGLSEAKKWILVPNYTDCTLCRNKLAMDLAKLVEVQYALDTEMIDLWVDGTYIGNYMLSEKVEVNENRVNLKNKYGVLAELDNLWYWKEDSFGTSELNGTHFVLKDSVADDTDQENSNALRGFDIFMQKINAFEDALYSGKDWSEVSSYIDVDSFIKMYFLQELAEDSDGCRSSFFLYSDGSKDVIHLGPAWDYDIAFGNFECEERGGNPSLDYIGKISTYLGLSSNVFTELLKYQEFRDLAVYYYSHSFKKIFSNIDEMIEEYSKKLSSSANMDLSLWDTLGKTAIDDTGSHVNGNSYREEVDYLKNWISKRVNYLDCRYITGFSKNLDIQDKNYSSKTPIKLSLNDGSLVTLVSNITKNGYICTSELETDSKGNKSVITQEKDNSGSYIEMKYDIDENNKAILTRVETDRSDITIPSKISINGTKFTVTGIGNEVFEKGNKIKTIAIEGKIKIVEKNAFSNLEKGDTIEINAKGKTYNNIVKKITDSGISKKVKLVQKNA